MQPSNWVYLLDPTYTRSPFADPPSRLYKSISEKNGSQKADCCIVRMCDCTVYCICERLRDNHRNSFFPLFLERFPFLKIFLKLHDINTSAY